MARNREQAAGRKGSGKKKMQTHQPLHTALYCTALHCTVCTARSRCRLASPRLASHCIASFRPVKLIPTSYLYFLVQVSRHVVCPRYFTLPVCSLGVVHCHCHHHHHHHHRRHTTTLHVLRSGRYLRYVGGYVGGYR